MIWADFWNSILRGDYLLALFQLILGVVITIVNIIIWPFSVLISTLFPSLDGVFAAISQYFTYAAQYMAYILDMVGLPAIAVTLIAAYYFFTWTVTFAAWSIKLLIKWRKALW